MLRERLARPEPDAHGRPSATLIGDVGNFEVGVVGGIGRECEKVAGGWTRRPSRASYEDGAVRTARPRPKVITKRAKLRLGVVASWTVRAHREGLGRSNPTELTSAST